MRDDLFEAFVKTFNDDEPRDDHGRWGSGDSLTPEIEAHIFASVSTIAVAALAGAVISGTGGAAIGAALAAVVTDGLGGFIVGSKIVGLFGKEEVPKWVDARIQILGAKSAYLDSLKAHLSNTDWQRLCTEVIAKLSEGQLRKLAEGVVAEFNRHNGKNTMNHFYAPLELKFADNAPAGLISGYAAVFGNQDSHGDVIRPGAFAESLAETKAAGRLIPMHLMHRVLGGDGLPVGVWTNVAEDDKGLKVEGKISGMNTDAGRLLYERVKDGALGGLSIGYRVKPDGAIMGKRSGEPKRTLTNLQLKEISYVDDPSNTLSRVDEIKSAMMDEFKEMMKTADVGKASAAIASAMAIHAATLTGSNSPTTEDRAALLSHLQDAHEAVTGQRSPPGMKSMPTTIREFEAWLREEFKLSNAQARSIAENGFKASPPRDEGNDPAKKAAEFLQLLTG